jgi:hypothetical protein
MTDEEPLRVAFSTLRRDLGLYGYTRFIRPGKETTHAIAANGKKASPSKTSPPKPKTSQSRSRLTVRNSAPPHFDHRSIVLRVGLRVLCSSLCDS